MTDCLLWNSLIPPNLATPTIITTASPAITLVPTAQGLAGYGTAGKAFSIPDHGNVAAGSVSVRILFRPVTWPGGFTAIIDKYNGSREFSIFVDTSGNISYYEIGAAGGSVAISTGMTAGGIWDFVITRSGTSAAPTFYVNGVAFAGSAGTGASASAGSILYYGFNSSTGGTDPDAQYLTAQVWNRALSAGEVLQLYRDPYCFLSYPQDAQRVGVAAAATFLAAWANQTNLPVLGTGTY